MLYSPRDELTAIAERTVMQEPTCDNLVWLDMEMTGLDPAQCVPLQVAVVITDGQLKELDALEINIWQPESELERMVPYVRRMHTKNGLLEQVRESETSLAQAEQALMSLLIRWTGYREGILAGNSIHTDRRFLEVYFPSVHTYLHYRMLDVSSLKELVRRWYGNDVAFTKSSQAHTALADARDSIAELSYYREHVMTQRAVSG